MKNNFLFRKIICTAVVTILMHSFSYAQWVSASNTDNYIASITAYFNGNIPSTKTAVIDYSNIATCQSCAPNPHLQMYALTWNEIDLVASQTSYVYVHDDGTGQSLTIPISNANWPSVVFGNVNNASSSDLYMQVVYADGNQVSVYSNKYLIHGVGDNTSTLTYTLQSSTVIQDIQAPTITIPFLTSYGNVINSWIDVIPEYGNLWKTNGTKSLPFCNKYIIAFDDLNGNVFFASADFNGLITPSNYGFSPVTNSINTLINLAAVQIKTGPTVSDYALLVQDNAANNANVNMYQWKTGSSTVSTTTIGTTLGGTPLSAFGMDAMKDYHLYGTGGVDWLVAFPNDSPGRNIQIEQSNNLNYSTGGEYINLAPSGSSWPFDLSSNSANNALPAVAIGPGNYYSVAYITEGNPANVGAGYPDCVAQQIDMSTGTFVNSDFYEIPQTHNTSNVFVSIGSSCNTNAGSAQVPPYLYTFWLDGTDFYEKRSADPYSFKPTSVANVTKAQWSIYPSPTISDLNIVAPTGTALAGNSYSISDMAGRTILKGAVTQASQQVNVEKLASGVYMINILDGNNNIKVMKFTKE